MERYKKKRNYTKIIISFFLGLSVISAGYILYPKIYKYFYGFREKEIIETYISLRSNKQHLNLQENKESIKKFIENHPTSPYGYFLLAELFFRAGDYKSALPLYRIGMRLKRKNAYPLLEDKDLYYHIGYIYAKVYKNHKLAISFIEKAISLGKKQKESYIMLAKLYAMEGNTTKAIKLLNSLQIKGDCLLKAELFFLANSYMKAIEVVNDCKVYRKDKLCDKFSLLIKALYRAKKYDDIYGFYEKMKEKGCSIGEKIFFIVAKTYIINKDKEKAKEFLKSIMGKTKNSLLLFSLYESL